MGGSHFFLFLWVNNERSGVYVIHEKSCQTQNAWNNARLDFLLLKQMLRRAMALRELTVSPPEEYKYIWTDGKSNLRAQQYITYGGTQGRRCGSRAAAWGCAPAHRTYLTTKTKSRL